MSNTEKEMFSNLVIAMSHYRGETITQLAEKLETSSPTLSNILSRRFSGKEKERELADVTKDTLKEVFQDVLGELYVTHEQNIEAYVEHLLATHRDNIKPR